MEIRGTGAGGKRLSIESGWTSLYLQRQGEGSEIILCV